MRRNFFVRNYNRLVDWTFWILFLLTLPALTRLAGLHDSASSGIWSIISATTWITTWVIAMTLTLARPMRDEFSEAIWQRSAAKFVFVMAIGPIAAIVILSFFIEDIADAWRLAAPPGIDPDGIDGFSSPAFSELKGAIVTIGYISMYFPLVFLAVYKWQRWRAG